MTEEKLNIVLAGQANVGKSVIFNQLTGLHQHIGNWSGKTVEKAEGTLYYHGFTIDVLDLPGIYSLTTYSAEELISREYIALQKPDFIVNVVDATSLERNLIFTLQLLELGRPTVLALNMRNLLEEKGIRIDYAKLEEILGTPVIPVAAIYGKGITEILDEGIGLVKKKTVLPPFKYGQEVEKELEKLIRILGCFEFSYPERWLAIKLLEKDKEIEKLVSQKSPKILEEAKNSISLLEQIHQHDSAIIISNERCNIVSQIIKKVVKITKRTKVSLSERLDLITTHKIWGYFVLILILCLTFGFIALFGNWFSSFLERIFLNWQFGYEDIFGNSFWASLGWSAIESALALIQIALPYILPFYLILYLLEDWGYLARIAYLTDNLMHKVGIHGKACIPLLLSYGCNVPGCLSCRILETQRERFIAGLLTTFIPCSAVTVIILGLVGRFVGMGWAFGLYLFNIVTIFVLGKLVSKILPGEPTELIMEMPDYRQPHLKTVLLQTWFRLKEFISLAGPLVIVSGVIIHGFYLAGWLNLIATILAPITVNWLGLPMITGILLIFGILRKELILLMLATLVGTTNFSLILNSHQMITLAIVSIFYIPCVATIASFKQEFGWGRAMAVTAFKILFAITLGGITSRILQLISI